MLTSVYKIVLWRVCGNSRNKCYKRGVWRVHVCFPCWNIHCYSTIDSVCRFVQFKLYFKDSKSPLQPVYNIDKWTCHDVRKRDSEMYKQSVIINNISINNNTEIVEIGLYYVWSLLQKTTKDLQVWRNLSKVPDINAWNLSLSIYALKCNLKGSLDGIKCFSLHL